MPRSVVRLSAGRLNFSRSDQVCSLTLMLTDCSCAAHSISLLHPQTTALVAAAVSLQVMREGRSHLKEWTGILENAFLSLRLRGRMV